MNAAYRHPLTRDLQWALGSAPLLDLETPHCSWPARDWFAALEKAATPQLQSLDADPAAFEYDHPNRLGHYFEGLWRYALNALPRFDLLHHNLPVRDGSRTVGEFDLIVADRETGTVEHWELAVKFYLGFPPTRDPARWIGPGGREHMDEKLTRLTRHQTRLSLLPAGRRTLDHQGLHIDRRRAIVKGRLFYPLDENRQAPAGAHPGHLQGWWATPDQFRRHFSDSGLQWTAAAKQHWLAPWPAGAAAAGCRADELLARVSAAAGHRPQCVIACNHSGERTRGFLVPAGWPGTDRKP